MNTKAVPKEKKMIAAVDIAILMLLLLCAAGIIFRVALGDNSLFSKETKGEYIVSYSVLGIPDEYSDYFTEGKEFYLEDGELLGTLRGTAAFTYAEIHGENSAGEYVSGYTSEDIFDVKGTATVKGTMTESGFVLSSGTYIAPNMTLTLQSSDITVEVLITDIVKAQ